MSNARNLARLIVDSGGDVDVSSLGNVPPSNDASALTTGTLPVGRLPSSGVDASSLTAGTLPLGRAYSGALLKMEKQTNSTYQSTSSASWTNVWTPSYTPVSANSTIYVTCMFSTLPEGSNGHSYGLDWRQNNFQEFRSISKASGRSGWDMDTGVFIAVFPNTTTATGNLRIYYKNSGANGIAYWNYDSVLSHVVFQEIAN